MNTTQHSTVAKVLPQFRDCLVEGFFGDFRQHFLAQILRNLLHLIGNSCIFVCQVRMVCPGINDAQSMAAAGEIKVHRPDIRMRLVREVNGNQSANRGSRLVHQTAGLAEEHILGILADLSHFRLRYLTRKEQMVDDGANEHLIGCGRAEARTGQDRGLTVGIKALDIASQLSKPGCHAANQRGGRIDFLCNGLQFFHVDNTHRISLGQDPDGIGTIDPDGRPGIQIHRAGQNPATLMVGMITADFGTSGSGKIPFRRPTESRRKSGIQNHFLFRRKEQLSHKKPPKTAGRNTARIYLIITQSIIQESEKKGSLFHPETSPKSTDNFL